MQTVKTVEAGDTRRVCVYTRRTRWDSRKAKQVKDGWREKANALLSLRLCREKLESRIACNFGPGDWHIVLTLADGYNTTDYNKLRDYWRHFIRQFGADRAKRGQPKPVYLYVMEGIHGDKRLHLHVLLQAAEGDIEAINRLWIYGAALLTPLESFAHRDNMAEYLSKEPSKFGRPEGPGRERNLFVASHNCRKPERWTETLPDGEIYQVPPGWRVEQDSTTVTNGYGTFQYYNLTRI